MKKIICFLIVIFSIATGMGQLLSTSNKPSQTSSRSALAAGPSVYGVFVGRTPCREFMREMNLEVREECAKRKMGIILYHDPVSHQPTAYETWGMDKRTGKGKWHIVRGTSVDPEATVFQLELNSNTSLFLLKGDDNVLFILDRNKNFLIGNAAFSYTFNRARN